MKRFRLGTLAPDFTLPNDEGLPTSLKSHRGRTTVLYFIPKAGSPGCVEQACALKPVAKKLGLSVIGVAPDSQRKMGMARVTLILDERGRIVKTIGGVTPKEHAAEVKRFFG